MHRIVTANYLVGDVDIGRAPQDRAFLQDHRVAVALAERANDLGEGVDYFRRHLVVLGLQLVLGILVVALEVFELGDVLVLQILALILVHQHALFLDLILKRLDLVLLALEAAFERGDAALEFGLGLLARVAFVERALHVNVGELKFGARGNSSGRNREYRAHSRSDEQSLPHTARTASLSKTFMGINLRSRGHTTAARR